MKVLLGILATGVAFGQAQPARPEFEVASIRPSQPSGQEKVGVGLRMDGSQARIAAFAVRDYIAMAYRVKAYQVSGPDWIASERFDISAKLPEGSTASQIPEMVQSLFADRFQLKVHHDKKDLPVYALIVGKPPLKLKETPPDSEARDAKGVVDVAGFGSANGVSVNMGNGSYYTFANNKFEVKKVTMDALATVLERYLDRPIVNLTGLRGSYDFTLNVTPEDYQALLIRAAVNSGVVLPPQVLAVLETGSASSLFDSLQQLGLKLDSRKAPLDLLVVDQVLKTPTDN